MPSTIFYTFKNCEEELEVKVWPFIPAQADLDYVSKGTAVACGLDMEPIHAEVHRSNMSKMWTFSEIKKSLITGNQLICCSCGTLNNCICDESARCLIARDSSEKIIKSPSYSPANLQPLIEAQCTSPDNK